MCCNKATEPLLRALDEIRQVVRDGAEQADRRSAMSPEIIRWLVEHRLFRSWIPRSYGGLELTLPEALSGYEAAARIDGSFGWSVMIGAGGGLFAAYLDPPAAREIFAQDDAVIAGSGAPHGRAERVPGGYRVRGRWRYASGAPYATTFTANCVVTSGGEPVLDAGGAPLVRAMAFDRADVEIIENWDAAGMRGTASHDFAVENVFVPERRSFNIFTDTPYESGPLYRIPFQVMTELPLAAVALGIARHALDAIAELAATKTPLGAGSLLAEDPLLRAAYASAHGTWRLARSGVFAQAAQAWAAAVEGRRFSSSGLAEITAVCVRTVGLLREMTDELIQLAGMQGVNTGSHLARAARDITTLGAHIAVSPRQLAAAGEALLTSEGSG